MDVICNEMQSVKVLRAYSQSGKTGTLNQPSASLTSGNQTNRGADASNQRALEYAGLQRLFRQLAGKHHFLTV